MTEINTGIHSKITTTFRNDIIKEALKSKLSNPKNKMNDDALELICEISKAMVIEAAVRAAKFSSLNNGTSITLEHVENILPQMMLDFP